MGGVLFRSVTFSSSSAFFPKCALTVAATGSALHRRCPTSSSCVPSEICLVFSLSLWIHPENWVEHVTLFKKATFLSFAIYARWKEGGFSCRHLFSRSRFLLPKSRTSKPRLVRSWNVGLTSKFSPSPVSRLPPSPLRRRFSREAFYGQVFSPPPLAGGHG